MKLSARNVLKGKVKSVKKGAVNTEVIILLPNRTELVSIITNTSAKDMKLKKGKEIFAIIKASNVILGIDCKC